jgi:hypothetical protein
VIADVERRTVLDTERQFVGGEPIMDSIHDVVSEHISRLITYGQRVYDANGNKVGAVDGYDNETGWMTVQKGAFMHQDLYIPFRAIATIDEREITLSLSKDDLLAAYTNPPLRTTVVERTEVPGTGVTEDTTTTVPSGYTGAPLLVDHTNLDEIKRELNVGMRVFDVNGDKVGTMHTYNIDRDYLEVTGIGALPHGLYIPLALVDGVDSVTGDVHLAVTKDHLRRVYVSEPADGSPSSTVEVPAN